MSNPSDQHATETHCCKTWHLESCSNFDVELQHHKSPRSRRLRRFFFPIAFTFLVLLTGLLAFGCIRDGHFSNWELDELLLVPRSVETIIPVVIIVSLLAPILFIGIAYALRKPEEKKKPQPAARSQPQTPRVVQPNYLDTQWMWSPSAMAYLPSWQLQSVPVARTMVR